MKTTLRLRVIPNARRNEIIGPYGEALKIKIAAPALEGKANAAVREFIADQLGLSLRQVELISGEKCRDKVLALEGMSPEALQERLTAVQA